MKLENMKQEIPNMPNDMRAMVEREVAKQLKTVKSHFPAAKIAAASVAAVLVLGTTVYAGGRMYQMQRESVGEYGVETKIQKTQDQTAPLQILPVALETGYLPDGMMQTEEGKFSFSHTRSQGGVSIVLYQMDQGDEAFEVVDKNVLDSEDIKAGGHEGVYLELDKGSGGIMAFNQRIYLSFPEVHYVVQMYIGEDISREEALKIAGGLRLVPVGDEKEGMASITWSEYAAFAKEEGSAESDMSGMCLAVSKEEMQNVHKIGDTFSFLDNANPGLYEGLTITVEDAEVLDDIHLLKPEYLDEAFDSAVDSNGRLLSNQVQYIKSGNGTDSLDEVIDTREAAQKLVYVTVEYKNTGSADLKDVLYFGSLMKIQENADDYAIYQGETPKDGDAWDTSVGTSAVQRPEMIYSDVLGGADNKNYIDSLKPGETETVHMAFVVNEDELGLLYLNLDPYGGAYEFTENSLEMGLVKIR